eukprot:6202153-Pleurochrysis_carterae.AAC.6
MRASKQGVCTLVRRKMRARGCVAQGRDGACRVERLNGDVELARQRQRLRDLTREARASRGVGRRVRCFGFTLWGERC